MMLFESAEEPAKVQKANVPANEVTHLPLAFCNNSD